jgi:DNA (cytosine-5)-methyltransferase 1
MRLTSFHSLGVAHNAPRLWLESHRLHQLGFEPGTPIEVSVVDRGLKITSAILSDRFVTRAAGGKRPIIDINSHRALAHLEAYGEVCVRGSYGCLMVFPSVRAAHILRGRAARSTYSVLDLYAGGGTFSDAVRDNPRFEVIAGVEVEIAYADEWARKHPKAELIQGNFRRMHPSELPDFDVLFAGIPCIEHSAEGVTKKGLAGIPELGDAGDLYIPTLSLIAAKMPSAAVLENVAVFGRSLAGLTVEANLRRLGYHVTSCITEPNRDYGEISNRRRWVCVATLKPGFIIPNPRQSFQGCLRDYLDPVDAERDRKDAARIAKTISGLRAHNARHAAQGHGFSMKFLTGSERCVPTFTKSYCKINSGGAYIETPYGPRMVRPAELCRIHKHTFHSNDDTTIYKMSGQGVLTEVFRKILNGLGDFLP